MEERLGEGAVGVVYRAVHVGLEKAFAIKLLKTAGTPVPEALKRFHMEAMALGRLRHPNIVTVTDFGIDGPAGGLPYIVTELLEGWSLSDLYRDQCPVHLGLLEAERACWEAAEIPLPRPPEVELRRRLLRVDRQLDDAQPRSAFARYSDELRRFAAETRAVLTRGTTLLFYDFRWSQSFLFVVEAAPGVGDFFYSLAIGEDEIQREVEAFRDVWDGPSTDLSALKERGRRLYDLLVRPAEPVLAKADRWLISPDGPLKTLPFQTLFSGIGYLADLKPIYIDRHIDRSGC